MTYTKSNTREKKTHCTPWTLRFEQDGTENIAIIRDANGDPLVTSRQFWLPQGDDPMPTTLTSIQLMLAAPMLLDLARRSVTILNGQNAASLSIKKYLIDAQTVLAGMFDRPD